MAIRQAIFVFVGRTLDTLDFCKTVHRISLDAYAGATYWLAYPKINNSQLSSCCEPDPTESGCLRLLAPLVGGGDNNNDDE